MSRHNLGEKNMNIDKELELELTNDHHYQLLLGEIKDLHKRQAILEMRLASYDKLRLSIENQISFKIRNKKLQEKKYA